MKYWHEIGQVSYVLYRLSNLEALQIGIKKFDEAREVKVSKVKIFLFSL